MSFFRALFNEIKILYKLYYNIEVILRKYKVLLVWLDILVLNYLIVKCINN